MNKVQQYKEQVALGRQMYQVISIPIAEHSYLARCLFAANSACSKLQQAAEMQDYPMHAMPCCIKDLHNM